MELAWTEEMLDGAAGPMPVRIYRDSALIKSPPLVLHLHGGTFLGGSAATGRLVATLLAQAGAIVVSADYSGTIDQPFPRALQLSFGLLGSLCGCRSELAGRKSALFVAGEEAGGNLAAGLALLVRDQHFDRLAGQILLSPMLDPCMATRSFRKAGTGQAGCSWADGWNRYLGFAQKACHPYAAPALCARLAGVAPALVLTADDDPMHDESLNYAARLREAGVPVHEHVIADQTGWPCSLSTCQSFGLGWTDTVRSRFVAFFQETGALPTGT